MTRIEELEQAVVKLTPEEFAEFRQWFAEYDAGRWDRQIEQDSTSGALLRLAERARTEYSSGETREL